MPTSEPARALVPDDVLTAAGTLAPLAARADGSPSWAAVAAPTSWTAARAIEHVVDALLFYAGQVARRADGRLPVLLMRRER